MMDIQFTQTMQHVHDFAIHHWRKHTLRRFLSIFLIIFAVLSIVMLFFINGEEELKSADVLSFFIPMLLILIIWVFLMPLFIKMRFNKSKDQRVWTGERTVTLEEDKVKLQTENVNTEYKWSGIKKVEVSKLNYLLYVSSVQAIIIPRDAFLTDTEREAFELILKEKGKF
jgi:cell division protein FtsW (lipid II flippase)